MGRDPKYICSRPTAKTETVPPSVTRMANVANEAGSSDEDDDEDEDAAAATVQGPLPKAAERGISGESNGIGSKTAVPLVDYILNVVSFWVFSKFTDFFLFLNYSQECFQSNLVPFYSNLIN